MYSTLLFNLYTLLCSIAKLRCSHCMAAACALLLHYYQALELSHSVYAAGAAPLLIYVVGSCSFFAVTPDANRLHMLHTPSRLCAANSADTLMDDRCEKGAVWSHSTE
jgi:hypothetical protein